jgi:hypothetical protein
VLAQVQDDDVGEHDGPDAGRGLGRAEGVAPAAQAVDLPGDPDGAGVQVDVLPAKRRKQGIERPAVEFRYLTVHPEAVCLKAHPAAVLYPLRLKTHEAVLSALGPERFTEPAPDRAQFLPHVTIGYLNRDGDTEPIAAALSKLTTRAADTTFTKADLLEFHRDNQMYEWNSATPIPIGELCDPMTDVRRIFAN